MKTLRIVLAALALGLGLTGCATMYQQMGLATAEDLKARDQRLETLETQVKDVAGKVEETSASAQRIGEESRLMTARAAEVEALMKALEGKVDQLPQETLKRLADILNRAADEALPVPPKP